MDARVSPDAKWLAWESDASGRREIYLGPIAGSATPLRVSKAGGGSPRWRGDGRELLYMAPDGQIVAVATQLGERPQLGEARAVSPVVNSEPFTIDPFEYTRFEPTPQGDRFLMQSPPDLALRQLTLVQGWQAKIPR